MRKALVVGINYYEHANSLHGCVDDAHSVKAVLDRHADGSVNFSVRLLSATGANDTVTRRDLKDSVTALFADDADIALFYFAGHGYLETTGGYLLTSDCRSGDDGLALSEVMTIANNSRAANKIIILDSCHSGIVAASLSVTQMSEIRDGTTIMTASTADQYASEDNSGGLFTRFLVDALSGSAANLVGHITPGSIYAHIDQSLGPWEQRPVFKTNVKRFVSLRTIQPPIDLSLLRRLPEFFPGPGFEFQLDPSFEPEMAGRPDGTPMPVLENTEKFAVLQKYSRVNLVVPVGAPHMWHAAMGNKACKLTVVGEHYRQLVRRGLI